MLNLFLNKRVWARSVISFRAFFLQLETRIGRVLLPIDPDALTVERLISSQAAYPELARSAAVQIYHANACRSLDDPVSHYPTLDALGRLKQQRFEGEKLDITAADFLESLGQHTNALLMSDPQPAAAPVSLPAQGRTRNRREAPVGE